MGYWNTNPEGHSLLVAGNGMVWGDAPADIMDATVAAIRDAFIEDMNREPTIGELKAGLNFALMGLPDDASADQLDVGED